MNHNVFCDNITELEKLEIKNKKFSALNISYDTPLKPKHELKLIKLIDHQPIKNFTLNEKYFYGLYDTESMRPKRD